MALPQAEPKLFVPRTGPEMEGNHILRKQHSEDVVSRRTIDLGYSVNVRQVGGARQTDSGGGGVDLLLRYADGWVILRGFLDGLGECQYVGSRILRRHEKTRTGQ